MSFPLTIHGPMPAADWVTQNPLLAQFEIGQELDGGVYGGAKMGPGYWNSLQYWNPANGILEVADGGRLLFPAPPPLGFRVKDAGFTYELIDPDNYDSVAGWYRIPVVQTAVLQADFPKTNNTLAVVTGWDKDINLLAGHIYRITGTANANPNNSPGGFQLLMGGGSATFLSGESGGLFGYDVTNTAALSTGNTDPLTTGLTNNSDGYAVLSWDFIRKVDTAGTLIAQFAQAATNATASILNKYATITAEDVTP